MAAMKYSYLSVLLMVAETVFCQESFRVNPDHLNKRLLGHVLFDMKVNGLIPCVQNCKFLGDCESVNFIKGNNSCEINDISSDLASPGELVTEAGTIFGDMTEFPSVMVGGCANHKCGYHQRCYPAGSSYVCADIECGSLPSISNGVLSLDSSATTLGSTASVTCNPGYSPKTVSIVCQPSGEWGEAQCLIECGSLPSISNGVLSLDSSATTSGSTASVTCNPGYSPKTVSIVCKPSGEWGEAECLIECGSLPSISNGVLSLDSSATTLGSTASVTCNPGYSPKTVSIVCQPSGEWGEAECLIDCGSLPTISNGVPSLHSSTTQIGATATVECNTGYLPTAFTISCTASGVWTESKCLPTDCYSAYHNDGKRTDGIYTIVTWKTYRTIDVSCDMTTDGGGWTVFQYRFDGSVEFYRDFAEYENGFGNLNTEFWLGLTYIQAIASEGQTDLRIDLEASNGDKAFEQLDQFYLSDGPEYTLHLGSVTAFSGLSSRPGFLGHNGMKFSTYDRDEDSHASANCAVEVHGAWWYTNCYNANLNGRYWPPGTVDQSAMTYQSFIISTSLKSSKMMIRRK